MRTLVLLSVVFCVFLAGCKRGEDIVGIWSFPLPRMPLKMEFKSDGTYVGSAMGGGATLTGKYQVDGNVLAMDPPQVSGSAPVSVNAAAGQMRLEMRKLGPNAYRLSAPGLNFTMSKMRP